MSLHRRAPRTLADALGELQSSMAPATVLADVQTAWSDVVGEQIAAEAKPVSERAGVLTVRCSSSVWSQELELMSVQITALLNGRIARGRVTRLRCVVGG